ncbi:OmpH family outer membrane protein [Endozoicomonas sp. ONNA2]|uniref:OmpH family outer membrane protein n=1 Tax=Endozoicomonas sp. ONNA2 TaxID=2828741 RepID=UPI0021497C31|nr:OmpH family outer membrane protein [Endozoicomonas sp. ONNA2]
MKSIRLAFLALILLAPLANAATTDKNIGVLDTVMVLSESNAGKQYAKKSEARFKPQLVALQKLEGEVRNMQEKLQKDGPTLSAEQLKVRQLELQRRYEDLQLKGRQYQTDKAEADNAERERLRPKLQAAIDKVVSELKLDLIIDRQMAIYASSGIDITRKVIESLNQMK